MDSDTRSGWSAQVQILPFLEQVNLSSAIDYSIGYKEHPPITINAESKQISSFRIAMLLCPDEVRDERRGAGTDEENYPLNYGWNGGLWLVYDSKFPQQGQGALQTNHRKRLATFLDGTSNTLLFSEVKAYTPYFRNANQTTVPALPEDPNTIAGLGGDFKTETGHTEWVDGRVHQSGFTTTFAPNSRVPYEYNGNIVDIDWTNRQEGKGGLNDPYPTFAAVTSRSYHPQGVNIVTADGATSFIADDIATEVWRAMGTAAGREVVARD